MWKAVINGASGILGTILQNVYNTRQIKETNEANKELVSMQNASAKEESELAYKRSLPQNQVANLMSAGMSRAGAINTLNGGGSYQPAPVAVSENEAPQIDLSQAINAVQASAQIAQQSKQLEEQKRQFNLQHEEQKRQFNENLELEKFKANDAAGQNAALRNLWHEEQEVKRVEKKLLDLRYELETANKNQKISTEQKELIARQSKALLEDIQAQKAKIGYDNLSPTTIQELAKIQATLEIMGNFGTMTMSNIIEWIHNVIDSLPFS